MVAVATSGTATVTLPTDEQILITREFDAPRHRVDKAWTTPELATRWMLRFASPTTWTGPLLSICLTAAATAANG